ncbi:MAG: hypothetical protein Rhims3KO_32830 [Hyphomicrobiales bacterium]
MGGAIEGLNADHQRDTYEAYNDPQELWQGDSIIPCGQVAENQTKQRTSTHKKRHEGGVDAELCPGDQSEWQQQIEEA